MSDEIRKKTYESRQELTRVRGNLKYGAVPFTDDEKDELDNLLVTVEQLRAETEVASLKAFYAEKKFKDRFVELAAKHDVNIGSEVVLPSKGSAGVRLVSGPSELAASTEAGRPCEKLHSCIACDTVCCWAWECGACEGCHQCTIGT